MKSFYTIPPYQRPYSWEEEQCQQLWDDMLSFYDSQKDENGRIDDSVYYFLGAIVTCGGDKQSDGTIRFEIVDGQQRITTLTILLRVLFEQISKMPENQPVKTLKDLIAPCLWKYDPMNGIEKIDKSQLHIRPQEAGPQSSGRIFSNLISSGEPQETRSQYEKNFKFFQKITEEFTKSRPSDWFYFIQTILKNCIIFPIDCDSQDSALLIFNTLNSKGLPLEDSDIIKAYIYKNLTSEDQDKFIEQWQEMVSKLEVSKLSTDHIFRVYMHIHRAKTGDTQNEIGLRKYFLQKNSTLFSCEQLPEMLDEFRELADFWHNILGNINGTYITDNSRKYLHVLSYCTNDYWKYSISVFFYKNYMEEKSPKDDFSKKFELFLKRLTCYMFFNILAKKPVNRIKDKIYELNSCIYSGRNFNSWNSWGGDMDIPEALNDLNNNRAVRGILLLYAYSFDDQQLIDDSFEIEHIYPQKGYRVGMGEYLHKIGNKVVIEKKINASVGNSWFNAKKEKYRSSRVVELQKLSQYPNEDWLNHDIENRQRAMVQQFEIYRDFLLKGE